MTKQAVAARKTARVRTAKCTTPPKKFPCRIISGVFVNQADYDEFKRPKTWKDYESVLNRRVRHPSRKKTK